MYKYSLHKKSIKHHCPNCNKKRFVRYIDNETQEYISSKVGRCDREINCGYHYKPKQYFFDNDLSYVASCKNSINIIPKDISFHKEIFLNKSLNNNSNNEFLNFLFSKFNKNKVDLMIEQYKIGTANFWYDGTIFWQIDVQNNIRGGKIIKYQKNGKRTKYINWVHSYLLKKNIIQEFNLKQCFFGEHLINTNKKIIAIVESEKTACIMSLLFDKYLWLATGSLSGLSYDKIKTLKNRKIVLYPDLGKNTNNKTPYNLWKNKCAEFKKIGFNISISDLLEKKATEEQRKKGLDIADYFTDKQQSNNVIIVKKKLSNDEIIFNDFSKRNNSFNKLISSFDLYTYDNNN